MNDDLPIKWVGDDGTRHEATLEHVTEIAKKIYDEFPGGLDELESYMRNQRKLYAFFREVARLTVEHDVVVDMDNEDHAVVFPSKLGEALEKVDPDWFNNRSELE